VYHNAPGLPAPLRRAHKTVVGGHKPRFAYSKLHHVAPHHYAKLHHDAPHKGLKVRVQRCRVYGHAAVARVPCAAQGMCARAR
jgi:hypothetical protein